MKSLNLGCGKRYHPDWMNVDFAAIPPHVIGANLLEGIPYDSESFSVVYHSHILEHFTITEARRFLDECYRVLIPDGTMRVVIPDLEGIARGYIEKLEAGVSGVKGSGADYDWMMLELYDQVVRVQSGGEMKKYLSDPDILNLGFVSQRVGRLKPEKESTGEGDQNAPMSHKKWRRFFRLSSYREKLIGFLLGGEYAALQEGRFRRSGEIHQWMYDRYSLGRILETTGFIDIHVCAADQSLIPQWIDYRLDTERDGSVRKPDSLFMECKKPG